ncbi:AI-2E family transporter [Georgenia wutianyii]|uniref:AI-2E family transporter n=1 Tax=Georgenia wutianyii TaxID=2585135 RepID=A0ABX5VNE9_9MICO|nr:AI-2E family transporter [Georgenia wutianyii]QDB78350.1 AI-2E family transporter [Georgenia wutianyii]
MTENRPGWLARLTPERRAEPLDLPQAPTAPVRPARATEEPAQYAVPYPVRAAAAWAWRFLAIAAAVALVGYVVVVFKTVVVAFVIAILLAVLLDPVSAWLRKRLRFPRTLAAIVTLLGVVAVVSGLLTLAGRSIINGFTDLADQAVRGFDELLAWVSDGPLGIDQDQLQAYIDEALAQVETNAGALASGALAATTTLTEIVAGVLISIFCLFFFLKEGRRIWQWFVRLMPVRARSRANEAGIRGWITLGGYARTQILVAFVDSLGIGLGAWILGLPLVLPLTILVFLGAFIPIVGALISGSVAVLVALVDQDVRTAVIMFVIVLAVQQFEGNVLQPWLMGNAVSLHPVAVLLAVTAGTGVAGVLGALLAVPVAAVVNTVVLYLAGHDKHPRAATDWHRPGGPPGTLFRSIKDSFESSTTEEEEDEEDKAMQTASVTSDEDAPADLPGTPDTPDRPAQP